MNDKSIVLSISMLISGKDDMLKSLESLQYFKKEIPCEVILVDTGCSAEQRALAEGYADKMLDFEWCNDFAAARNVGLKTARGEWFMYLDDDEWFDNPKEIIDFFRSGEYRKYNSATYKVRNYFSRQGKSYDETVATRMIKLEKKTVFVGKIHEYLFPFTVPTKNFSDFVHHYGYAFKNAEERRKHAYRNIAPLVEMGKEEPEDIRWQCQLAQEYFALDEYSETARVCVSSLERRRQNGRRTVDNPAWVGSLYGFLLISLESQGKFMEEEQWLEKALAEPAMPEATRAYFYFAGTRMYCLNGKEEYEKCRECVKKYIKYMLKLQNDRRAISEDTALITSAVFQEHRSYPALLLSMKALIRLEDYALAEEAFYLIDWSDSRMLRQNQEEKNIVDACCSVSYHPLWVKLLQTLVSREDGMKEMYAVFLETEIMYKQQGETEKLSRLRHLVAELDYEHLYILYTRILWTEENPDFLTNEERKEILEKLFGVLGEKYSNELFEIRAEVWNVAQRQGISMEPALLRIDYRSWKQMLDDWLVNADMANLQQWDKRIGNWKQHSDIRYDLFVVKCMEGYLRHYQEIFSSLQQMEQLLWKYADSVLTLYRFYYKEFVFEEMPMLLPEDAQLALQLKVLQHCREQGDDRGALKNVRKCLGIYSALENVVSAYAKMYRDEVQRRSREAEKEQLEFIRLVNSLKATAGLQLERKEYQAAKEILLQVQQCVPEDDEVRRMLEQIPEGQ